LTSFGLLGVFLGLVLSARLGLGHDAHAAPPSPAPIAVPLNPAGPGVSFVKLVKDVGPAVVSIDVKITRQSMGMGSLGGLGGLFPFDEGPQVGEGQGSGFLISADGYILTNDHVVGEASDIKVALSDGRELPGKVIGTDSRTDIALIKVEDKRPFPFVRLGDSEHAEIGEWVVAIGNPFGLDHTVTAGIISAKGRRNVRPSGRKGLYDFIQTDASINPGNSGGPLLNVNGEVIGINAAVNAQGQGIGFAIPINMAKTLLPMLKEHGKVARSYLGIGLQDLTHDLARSYGLPDAQGALINKIVAGAPAEKAGLKAGDIVTGFDGKPVRNADDLAWLASTAGAGNVATLQVTNKAGPHEVRVTLGVMPEDKVAFGERAPRGKAGGAKAPAGALAQKLGLEVTAVTPEIAQELSLDKAQGVAVVSVDPRGAAARSLTRGDVVVTVNDQPVNDEDAFGRALDRAGSGGTVRLLVLRGGNPLWVAFTVE
jgi:serine protease Do